MESRLHSERHYEAELKNLHIKILEMGGLVEKQIGGAVAALINRDDAQARQIIERDHAVNRMDVEVDELCLRLLALHQPAARDLRLITTGLKITTDLERIGDMAVNVCERVVELNREPQLGPVIDLARIAEVAQRMLHNSLDSFVREDTELALSVCREDDLIDGLTSQLFNERLACMIREPSTIGRAVPPLFIGKYLERIGDHATNIAEMVIFMVKGKSIRHMDQLPASL